MYVTTEHLGVPVGFLIVGAGSQAVSDSYKLMWHFSPTGLPCPTFIWWCDVSGFIAICYAMFSEYPREDNSFLRRGRDRWRGETGLRRVRKWLGYKTWEKIKNNNKKCLHIKKKKFMYICFVFLVIHSPWTKLIHFYTYLNNVLAYLIHAYRSKIEERFICIFYIGTILLTFYSFLILFSGNLHSYSSSK